ncbi:unnamed protein product [Ectocarpus sp. CCAP 1310/34]|nr:unnamed protein product [Ectocarpus sp. CCAP 1310/34]
MRDGRSEEEATLVCHTRPSSAQEIREVCSRLRWYLCEALGIKDFGDDTGCSSTAPSLKETFDEISAWLDLPENSEELLFIKIEDYTGDNVGIIVVLCAVCCFRLLSVSVSLLPDYITTVFGTKSVFGPLDFIEWNRISETEQWPTTEYLVSQGKRLVFGTNGQEDADSMFRKSRENDADGLFHELHMTPWRQAGTFAKRGRQDITSAIRFRTSAPCSTRTRSPSWSRVQ